MGLLYRALATLCIIDIVFGVTFNTSDANVDRVSLQLFEYRNSQMVPDLLTESFGTPVYIEDTSSLNTNLLFNRFAVESINHAVTERIPNRIMFAKAAGAHGYFEVLTDISNITKAKVFEKVGKRTKVFVRLSLAQVAKGGSDTTPISGKGFAVKFYTEEGNFDLLSFDSPVFIINDPVDFRSFEHAFRENPKSDIRDLNSLFDYVTLKPIILHTLLRVASEFGLSRGFRHMNTWACHTFELYNNKSQSTFVKFKWVSDLGFQKFTLEEASALSSYDPDFFMRDLYNSIARNNSPTWTLEMDVLKSCDLSQRNSDNFDVKKVLPAGQDFDPFDVTRMWPEGTYTTIKVGKLHLNENVKNYFAEVEQATFNPAHLVPGIYEPPDYLYAARLYAYDIAQMHRVGSNHNKIPVNCPFNANTYNRDGVSPVMNNGGDSVSYTPNSFNGPVAIVDADRPKNRLNIKQSPEVDFEASKKFYNEELATEDQKAMLVNTLAQAALRVEHTILERFIELLKKVDDDLANRFVTTLNALKATVKLPSVVEEVDPAKPNPFG